MAETLITLGGLLLLGLLTDLVGRRSPLPRVTLLIGVGFLIGPSGVDVLSGETRKWFPLAANSALVMVGFLLGGDLSWRKLRDRGRPIVGIAGAKVLLTFIVVTAGLRAFGFALDLSVLLGAIATATDPAAVADVVRQEKRNGPLPPTLLGVVALDDAAGLILFSLGLASVEALAGGSGGGASLLRGLWELGGGIALGVALGVPTAFLTGRLDPGEPTLVEALGVVFLVGGLAMWLDVSFLISSMALGATVASLARHHRRPFRAIEGIEWPFMILFFVLAGASFDVTGIKGVSVLLLAYVVFRSFGTVLGTSMGAAIVGSDPATRRWIGVAVLPQAGVALGMALVCADRVPHLAEALLHTTIAATLFFEVVGPVFTRLALRRAGTPAGGSTRDATGGDPV